MELGVALGLVPPGQVQECVGAALPLKISGGDGCGVLARGEDIGFLQPGAVPLGVLHDFHGVQDVGALRRVCGQGRAGQDGAGQQRRQEQGRFMVHVMTSKM